MKKRLLILTSFALTAAMLAGCADRTVPAETPQTIEKGKSETVLNGADKEDTESSASEKNAPEGLSAARAAELVASGMFSERDMKQTADVSSAKKLSARDGEIIEITQKGTYLLSGAASECTVKIDVSDKEKVQLILDGVSIANSDFACIYVKSADKVFVTLNGENTLSAAGKFVSDGSTNVDAVIFSKDDLVLNGTGTLMINSSANGITGKDDVKITGGTYDITAEKDGFEVNDSLLIADGNFTVNSGKNAFQCKNADKGNIYIAGGKFSVNASDDAVKGISTVRIDGGDLRIKAAEGIESTFVQINGGTLYIEASDDGINASKKSKDDKLDTAVEINGGDITIIMGPGDTDGIDSNGSIYVNGGTVNITGGSSFDYDIEGVLSGGTVYVNGEQVSELPNQMIGRGGFGGKGNKFPDGDFRGGKFPDGGFERGDKSDKEDFGKNRPAPPPDSGNI